MHINIESVLLSRGESIAYNVSESWAEGTSPFQGLELLNPLEIQAQMMNEGGGRLRLTGRARVRFVGSCARCADPVHQEQTVALNACFYPSDCRSSRQGREEDWETAGQLPEDAYPYEGRVIDLEPMLLETILPVLPLRLLCREDCAGLCPHCGANQNTAPCTCKIEEAKNESPFAGLMDLFKT